MGQAIKDRATMVRCMIYRSSASTSTAARRSTTRIPRFTLPKMVCLRSKCGVGASVIKNYCNGGQRQTICYDGKTYLRSWSKKSSIFKTALSLPEKNKLPFVFGPEFAIAWPDGMRCDESCWRLTHKNTCSHEAKIRMLSGWHQWHHSVRFEKEKLLTISSSKRSP